MVAWKFDLTDPGPCLGHRKVKLTDLYKNGLSSCLTTLPEPSVLNMLMVMLHVWTEFCFNG